MAFVEECQIVDRDVMGLHRSTDLHYIQSYVKSLAVWREERPSGVSFDLPDASRPLLELTIFSLSSLTANWTFLDLR